MNDNTTPQTSRRARSAGCLVGVLLLLAPLGWLIIPDTVSWRLEAATERAQLLRSELLEQECDRPALPGFEGEAPDLANLRFSHAWLVSPYGVRDALEGRSPGNPVSFTFAPAGTGPIHPRDLPPPYPRPAPLYPTELEPAELVEHRAHLAGLEEFLNAQMARQSHCSPLVEEEPGNVPLSLLAQNIAILARGKAQDGDLVRAIEILLHGAVLVRDFRLGPVELERALDSALAEAELYAHLQSLLYGPVELPPEATARFVALLRILQAHPTPLFDHLQASLSVSPARDQWTDTPSDERAHQAGRVFDGMVDVCGALDASLMTCSDGLRLHEFRKWPDFLGPLVVDRNLALRADQDKMRDVAHTLTRTAAGPVLAHQMELSLYLVAERAAGRCPPRANLPEDRLTAPFASGPTTFVERSETPGLIVLQRPQDLGLEWSAVFLCPAGTAGHLEPADSPMRAEVLDSGEMTGTAEHLLEDILAGGSVTGNAGQVLAMATGVGVPIAPAPGPPEPVHTDDGTRWDSLVIDGTLERDELEPVLQSALPAIRGCMASTPAPWSMDLDLFIGMGWTVETTSATPPEAFAPLTAQRSRGPTACIVDAMERLPSPDFHGAAGVEAHATLSRRGP